MTGRPNSRFLSTRDFQNQHFLATANAISMFYAHKMRGKRHTSHAKRPDDVKIHWSREWEYPWACDVADLDNLDADSSLLDVGCGGSPLLPYIQRRHHTKRFRVWGLDADLFSETWNAPEAHKYPHDEYCTLRHFWIPPQLFLDDVPNYVTGSMLALPFRDGWFDRVFCISVLEHLDQEEMNQSLREVRRVLRPGGLFIVTVDVGGDHCRQIAPLEFLTAAALPLYGEADFTLPPSGDVNGEYNVLGIVFHKPEK